MPLISKDTKGVFVISATPFDEVGNLDIDSVETMVNFYLDKGWMPRTLAVLELESALNSNPEIIKHYWTVSAQARLASLIPSPNIT